MNAGALCRRTTGHSGGSPSHRVRDLPDGVSPMQSHRYQEVFSVPEPEFVAHIAKEASVNKL